MNDKNEKVYVVPTDQGTFDHFDSPPPMCDYEVLYRSAPAPEAQAVGDLALTKDREGKLQLYRMKFNLLFATFARGVSEQERRAVAAALSVTAPKPEAQAAELPWLLRERAQVAGVVTGELLNRAADALDALSTPASHGAQQDTSPEYRRGWLAGVESMRQELAQQPAVVGEKVFYLVERLSDGVGGEYWNGGSSQNFTTSVEKAIQFRRWDDAYWVCRGWLTEGLRITEHVMVPDTGPIAAITPAATPGDGASELRNLAKRHLRSYIESGSTDKRTMLLCLEELS